MTLDQLNKLFRDTIVAGTTVAEAIKYYPNAPRPSEDYATVNVADLRFLGNGDIKIDQATADLDETVIMQYEAMISINFYKLNAMQNAGIMQGILRQNGVIDEFNLNGVGFTRASNVREVTQLINQGHEERGQVDVFVSFELTPIPTVVLGIDVVKIIGAYDNQAEVVEITELNITGA